MDDKKNKMSILELRNIYRDRLNLSNQECDYIYKVVLKDLCFIDLSLIHISSPRDRTRSRMPSSA